MLKSKFQIDDIVTMVDDFHFNCDLETISVGKVEAIHHHRKPHRGFRKHGGKRILSGRITYSISGFSLRPDEGQLELYKAED